MSGKTFINHEITLNRTNHGSRKQTKNTISKNNEIGKLQLQRILQINIKKVVIKQAKCFSIKLSLLRKSTYLKYTYKHAIS